MTTARFPASIYSQSLENAFRDYEAMDDGIDTPETRKAFQAGWVAMYSNLVMRTTFHGGAR